MSDRARLIAAFLDRAGWFDAQSNALAGDASHRRYVRLIRQDTGQSAVLMDAPPDTGERIEPFVRIATVLTGAGFSAPKILAQDITHGFLLLEDLGDAVYTRLLEQQRVCEGELYTAATDVLVALSRMKADGLEAYDPEIMADMCDLAFTRYVVLAGGDAGVFSDFRAGFLPILKETWQDRPVMMLRDYHADNLIWLPNRIGQACVGLLDFQDAKIGHPAYDLVSLLQDARRDVSPATEAAMLDRYIDATRRSPDEFRAAYAVQGLQRNLRILGVFARLASDQGKSSYLAMMPRVWHHVMRNLDHPVLEPVAGLLHTTLPEPTLEILERIEAHD